VPYANICEQCDFVFPDPQAAAAITAPLEDVRTHHDDAQARGWDDDCCGTATVAPTTQR
jgi:hypothetical protein